MQLKQIKLQYSNKKILIHVVEYKNLWQRFRGLMFCRREKARALLFNNFYSSIHSFFVFFSFLAIWLDEKNNVIEIKKIFPFNPYIMRRKKSSELLEIPINTKYSRVVKSLMDLRRKNRKI